MLDKGAIAAVVLDTIASRYSRAAESSTYPLQLILSDLNEREWYVRCDNGRAVVHRGRCEAAALSIEADTSTLAALISNTLAATVYGQPSQLLISGSAAGLGRILFDSNDWINFSYQQYVASERAARDVSLAAVEKRRDASAQMIVDHITRSIPLVIVDGVRIPTAGNLTVPALAERFGDVLLTSQQSGTVVMRQHLERVVSATGHTNGHLLPTEIVEALVWPESWPHRFMRSPLMFSSSSGQISSTHRHPNDVINAQIVGRKLWRLYSPDQTPLLYVGPIEASHQMSQVETSVDAEPKYPFFRLARSIDLLLEPGDVLVLPTGWYHEVTALEPSISCAFIVDGAGS